MNYGDHDKRFNLIYWRLQYLQIEKLNLQNIVEETSKVKFQTWSYKIFLDRGFKYYWVVSLHTPPLFEISRLHFTIIRFVFIIIVYCLGHLVRFRHLIHVTDMMYSAMLVLATAILFVIQFPNRIRVTWKFAVVVTDAKFERD